MVRTLEDLARLVYGAELMIRTLEDLARLVFKNVGFWFLRKTH